MNWFNLKILGGLGVVVVVEVVVVSIGCPVVPVVPVGGGSVCSEGMTTKLSMAMASAAFGLQNPYIAIYTSQPVNHLCCCC